VTLGLIFQKRVTYNNGAVIAMILFGLKVLFDKTTTQTGVLVDMN